jgi:hypothetical protein
MERNRLWKGNFEDQPVILWGGTGCPGNRTRSAEPHPPLHQVLQHLAAALNRRTFRLHESLLSNRQVGAVGRRIKRARPLTCSG